MDGSKEKGILLVISGPSGAGKGTVAKTLLKNKDYCFSVSSTTRKPRPGEINGVDYDFISWEEFESRIENGEMLEHAQYVGNLYGTPKKFVNERLNRGFNVLLDIETVGAFNVKELMPEALLVFVSPPSMEALEKRLRGRGTETEEVIQHRLKRAADEMLLKDRYDFVVINREGSPEEAAMEIEARVSEERAKRATLLKQDNL